MSLRYAILGYLSTGPGSGYDLALHLGGDLGWFWSASHAQIYPELRRLEKAGLIVGKKTTVGERQQKRVYTLSRTGRSALVEWASEPPVYRPNRDPERLQLIFTDLCGIEDARRHLEAHRDRYRDREAKLRDTVERITSRRHARIEQRIAARPPSQRPLSLLVRELAWGGDLARAELEVRWAEDALSRLEHLENASSEEPAEAVPAEPGATP